HTRSDRWFGRQALDAGSTEKAADAFGVTENVLRILRLGDGTAVAKDDDVGIDRHGGVVQGLNALGGLFQRESSLGADGPFRGQAHVRNQYIRARAGHRSRFILIKNIRASKQTERMSL